jgi:TP901 family phage tail tape measure protein
MAATTATLSMIISAKDYATNTLNSVGGSLNALERNVQRLNRQFQQFRTGVNQLSRYAMVAAGAITAGVSAIAYFGQETENAMANASTMFRVTSEDFKKYLVDDVSYYAKKYGQSMEDMWNAIYAFGSAGAELEHVPYLLDTVSKAAVAGAVDVETAFNGAIRQIKGFGLEMADIERVLAVQFQAVQSGLLTYEELATTIPEIAAAARTLGEDWVSATATFATLTRYMPSANQAATALRAAYTELTKKTDQLTKAGIRLYEDGEFIGFVNVLEQLTEQLEGKTNEEVAQFINSLGLTEEANKAITNLVNNFDELSDIVANTTDDISVLNEMFEKQSNTFAFRFRQFMVILNDLKQAIYDAFAGTLGDLLVKAGRWVQGLTEWIKQNKDALVELTVAVLRLLSIVIGFNFLLNMFSKMGGVLEALKNPFTWLFVALGALFASLDEEQRMKLFDAIINGVKSVINYIIELVKVFQEGGFLAAFEKVFKDLLDFIGRAWDFTVRLTVEVVEWLGEKIPEWIQNGIQFIELLIDKVDESNLPDWMKGILKGALLTAKLVLELFGDAFEWLSGILGATHDLFINLKEGNMSPMSAILKWLESIIDTTVEFAINVVSHILEWLFRLFGMDKEAAVELVMTIKGTMWDWYQTVKGWVENGLTFAVNIVFRPKEYMEELQLQSIYSEIYPWVEAPKSMIEEIAETIANIMPEPIRVAIEAVVTGVEWVVEKIVDGFTAIIEFFKWIGSKVVEGFTAIVNGIQTATTFTIDVVANVVSVIWENLKSATTRFVEGVGVVFDAVANFLGFRKSDETGNGMAIIYPGFPFPELLEEIEFSKGGYTGNLPTNAIAGVVHGGEYVIPANLVEQNKGIITYLERQRKGYKQGGLVGYQAGGIVEENSFINQLLNRIGSYFATGGIGKDIKGIFSTLEDALGFISEFTPEAEREIATIERTMKELLGITERTEAEQISLLEQLLSFYTEFGTIITKEGKPGELLRLFTIVPELIINGINDITGNAINKLSNTISGWFEGLKESISEMQVGERVRNIPVIGNVFGEIFDVVAAFASVLIEPLVLAIGLLENVQAILHPISAIVQSIMNVIGPMINSALVPFVNILAALGQMIGTLLLPIMQPFLMILQAIGQVFAWLYNTIFVPIARGLYVIFASVANAFAILYNTVSDVVRGLTFGIVNIGKQATKSMDQILKEAEEKLPKIDVIPGDTGTSAYETQFTSSVQRTGPEVVYQTVNIPITDAFIQDSRSEFKAYFAEIFRELVEEGQIRFG